MVHGADWRLNEPILVLGKSYFGSSELIKQHTKLHCKLSDPKPCDGRGGLKSTPAHRVSVRPVLEPLLYVHICSICYHLNTLDNSLTSQSNLSTYKIPSPKLLPSFVYKFYPKFHSSWKSSLPVWLPDNGPDCGDHNLLFTRVSTAFQKELT